MKFNFIILCIFLTIRSASQELQTFTVPVKDRVKSLKENIKKDIAKMGLKVRSEKSVLKGFDYHTHNGMIDPVVEDSLELKTTRTSPTTSSATKSSTTKSSPTKTTTTRLTTTLPLTTTILPIIREHEITSKYAKDASEIISTIETTKFPNKRKIEPIVEEDPMNRYYAKMKSINEDHLLTEKSINEDHLLAEKPMNEGHLLADKSINEGHLLADKSINEDHLLLEKSTNESSWQNQLIYRRSFIDEVRNKPLNWVHCQHLITPLFEGVFTEDDHAEPVLNAHSHDVMRLIYLLTVNTTTYEHQDLYALMYQISSVNVRLHQWDMDSLEFLMRVLNPRGRPHTLYKLKQGIRYLVDKWLMSLDNVTIFQEKAKLVRPPCLIPQKMLGSTLPLNTVTHPFPSKSTTKPCHSKKSYDRPEND